MNPGTLIHRITLRIPNGLEQNGVPQYFSGATVWASVEPLRGKEYWEAMATQSENTVRIKIRYLEGVKQEWRVLFENNEYEIINIIDPGMKHRELQLMCRQVI